MSSERGLIKPLLPVTFPVRHTLSKTLLFETKDSTPYRLRAVVYFRQDNYVTRRRLIVFETAALPADQVIGTRNAERLSTSRKAATSPGFFATASLRAISASVTGRRTTLVGGLVDRACP
jgi:hypothetical protein